MDANYYHYPAPWIGARPGFMTGGGFPMRFADASGVPIDVFQQNTNMNDEATTNYALHIDTLLDNALGPNGYYGAFGANMHTDYPGIHSGSETIVAEAQARGVPVISYKQLLDWVDGRDNSTIRGLSWSAGTLSFTTTVAAGANGIQLLLPLQGPTGHAERDLARRPAGPVHRRDDQGDPVRDLRRLQRRLHRDLLVGDQVSRESWRRRSAVVPPREKSIT